jgi:hypothetical protein
MHAPRRKEWDPLPLYCHAQRNHVLSPPHRRDPNCPRERPVRNRQSPRPPHHPARPRGCRRPPRLQPHGLQTRRAPAPDTAAGNLQPHRARASSRQVPRHPSRPSRLRPCREQWPAPWRRGTCPGDGRAEPGARRRRIRHSGQLQPGWYGYGDRRRGVRRRAGREHHSGGR